MRKHEWNKNNKKAMIVLLLVSGAFLYAIWQGQPSTLERSQLATATGKVINYNATGKGQDTLRFQLQGHDVWLVVHTGFSARGTRTEIKESLGPLTMLYDADSGHSPPLDSRSYHSVYEIRQGDRVISPYAQAFEREASNRTLGLYMAIFLLVAGVLSMFIPVTKSEN